MGNKESGIKKGSGYRVLAVLPGSPLQSLLQPFFDFILTIHTEQSPKQILQKLTGEQPESKPFMSRIREQQGKQVTLKVFSAKDCSTRDVQFTPNSKWSKGEDLLGVTFRLEKYEDVQENFCKITRIQPHSPIHAAGVCEGDYLIGVVQYKFQSITQLTDKLYQHLFNQQIKDKHITFALYDLPKNHLKLVPIELKRKWGGQGILGCELSHGHLYKFPTNVNKYREQILQQDKKRAENLLVRKEMVSSDGSGKLLAEALKRKQQGKKKTVIKNPERVKELRERVVEEEEGGGNGQGKENLEERVRRLERTVALLQQVILDD